MNIFFALTRRFAATRLSALVLGALPAVALPATVAMEVNQEQVRQWNRFAQALFELHEKAVASHEVRESEEAGRHGGEFAGRYSFREVSYHDAKSGRLLSRIRRGTDSPDKIQMIDVFIYDPSGRVTRDYTAIYLPWARNAPIRTYINLHQYQDGLHGFRQFDASGNRLYEQCRGKYSGGQVDLSLEDYRIDENITATTAYRACFGKLPATADNYLTPH